MSDDEKPSEHVKSSRGKSLGTELPNTTIENLKIIIEGFFQQNAHEKKVSAADISRIVGLHRDTVSKQLRFFLATKILEKIGRFYKLTEKGAYYAKLISWEQFDESQKVLSELLQNSSEVHDFLSWLKLQKGYVSKDEAIKRYGVISGIPAHRTDLRTGIETVNQLLIEANLVTEGAEGKIKFAVEDIDIQEETESKLKEETDDTLESIADEMKRWKQRDVSLTMEEDLGRLNLNITLQINNEIDPKWIKKAIQAIKEGWFEENQLKE